jgi:CDP-4-dehydro-6-deoxyglucose reductase, E3
MGGKPGHMPSFTARLVEQTPLSPRVVKMTFEASEPFPHAGGQYVTLTSKEGAQHAFSIASPFDSQAPRRFDIAVAQGTTAASLLELTQGDELPAHGPSGALVWRGDGPALLVATGTGISPLRALLLEQLQSSSKEPLVLLFGCRDATEELWGQELRQLQAEHKRFRFVATHSQPSSGYMGRIGRVQGVLPELVLKLGLGLSAYLCGHTPMVKDCTGLLIEIGVAPARIYGESY